MLNYFKRWVRAGVVDFIKNENYGLVLWQLIVEASLPQTKIAGND